MISKAACLHQQTKSINIVYINYTTDKTKCQFNNSKCSVVFYFTIFDILNVLHATYMHAMFYFLVSSCDQLTCGANEICVSAGVTYECVCHPDYEGENCQVKGPYNLITTSFN